MKKRSKVNKTKVTVIGALLAFVALAVISGKTRTITRPDDAKEFAETTAMITLESGRSGGSGVILHSGPDGSVLLTNKHVCQLIQVGGVVKTIHKTYPIVAYKVYDRHDLCMVKVQANLGINTTVASVKPEKYTKASISGHPNLLPPILTQGYFSDELTINVMVGTQPCDGNEEDEEAVICMFMGQKPLIKTFPSQVVSATIMAGSSGSGIFDANGEVASLVFAGNAEGLSYAFIVPHRFVLDFIQNQSNFEWTKPEAGSTKPFFTALFQLQDICANKGSILIGRNLIPDTCNNISFQSIGRR